MKIEALLATRGEYKPAAQAWKKECIFTAPIKVRQAKKLPRAMPT